MQTRHVDELREGAPVRGDLAAHRARYRRVMLVLENVTYEARKILNAAGHGRFSGSDAARHLWTRFRIVRARGEDWPTWLWIAYSGSAFETHAGRANMRRWVDDDVRMYVDDPLFVLGDHLYHGIK